MERRTRRGFSSEYKLRIVLGALLRRENLYSNRLQTWRRQLAEGGEQALSKSVPGSKPKLTAEQREMERLRQGLYASQLGTWRRQREAQGLAGLEPKTPGRKSVHDAKAHEIARLKQEDEKGSQYGCNRGS